MSERTIEVNGRALWTESFGRPEDPTVLLITGLGGQGTSWSSTLCDALVAGGRHVIRYDHRDVGRSSYVDFATEPYTIDDLAGDAVGLLDAYGIERAHLVGASMGGMVAQTMAFEQPARVASLISIMSTTVAGDDGTRSSTLPGPQPRMFEAWARLPDPATPLTDEQKVEVHLIVGRAAAGSLAPFDEAQQRANAERAVARATVPDNPNHVLAVGASKERTERLAAVVAPTLVIHGTDDPILPIEHGQATAAAIAGSRLVPIDGLGHELPEAFLPRLAELILEHTGGAAS